MNKTLRLIVTRSHGQGDPEQIFSLASFNMEVICRNTDILNSCIAFMQELNARGYTINITEGVWDGE